MNISVKILTFTAIFALSMLPGALAWADDFDDGMAIGEDIAADDQISKPDKNIRFIIMKAKSQQGQASSGVTTTSEDGDVVQGGAIVKPGAEVKGDIIVIYDGKNNVVVGK